MAPRKLSRRDALKLAAAAGTVVVPMRSNAERVEGEFQQFVPQDKKLDPKWVQKLYERGQPSKWSGEAAKFIGMPIGGLCCGQVYLGGDGQLWHWDICTSPTGWDMQGLSSGKHYANPIVPHWPIGHGFTIQVGDDPRQEKPLTDEAFQCEFENRYPIGIVWYRSDSDPIEIEQTAYSPFIPLATADSALPLVVQEFKLTNKSDQEATATLRCRLAEPFSNGSLGGKAFACKLDSITGSTLTAGQFAAVLPPVEGVSLKRSMIVFEDFSKDSYVGWTVSGTAFGDRPMKVAELPERYKAADPVGKAFVNSHQSRAGEDSVHADIHVGKMVSRPFVIERNHINFRIGGGNHPGKTCVDLVVDGVVEASATGRNSLTLRKVSFDVKRLQGKVAHFEVRDEVTGGWGHISIDRIVFADEPDLDDVPLDQHQGFGSIAIAVLQSAKVIDSASQAISGVAGRSALIEAKVVLPAGQSATVKFLTAWYFPNYGKPSDSFAEITGISKLKKQYAKRFKSALDVIRYFVKNEKRLAESTRAWAESWYDSTLPHYLLERAIIPVDCLQTATSHWFDSGRFYGWEGVYCCPGTCQHVWNYAQGAARLFPELERSAREHADYGISWQPDGTIWYRGESGRHMAHDGQAGTILRTYREHTMTADGAFLKRNWPKIKKSIERLIKDDPNKDGLWEGEQYNTLDSSWFGKISWISSLYIAALRSGVEMATETGDTAFSQQLRSIVERGSKAIVKETYNGEYFAMVRDPNHPRAPGHGPGCHIDQVFGDSFLHMVGLPANLPQKETRSALRSIWKYNYAPDAGGYFQAMQSVIKGGRWYAMPGEPGLLMTTFPRGGAKESKGEGNPDWMVGYFNECMNGFEYQAAAHMIAEGMVTEGLAIVHSLHERYSGGKRNPYNEVECSDHYSRSMASYGAFLTASGFRYHGPKGEMSFAPKMPGYRFRAAFTAAEGWGSFEQIRKAASFEAKLELKFGRLRIAKLGLAPQMMVKRVEVRLGTKSVEAEWNGMQVEFKKPLIMKAGESLSIMLSSIAKPATTS